jgi:putative membrane protein
MNYRDFQDDDLILRDLLALDRTRLANERTFLAYVRTAIMLGVSGVSFIKLFPNSRFAQISGWALLPIAALLMLFAIGRFLRIKQSLSAVLSQARQKREASE